MEQRRFGEACPKFEAAYAKDHALGTLINLAFCHKEQNANWYAWLEFREAEVLAVTLGRADRRDFARQRLAELETKLPKVIIDNPQKLVLTEVLVEDRKVWEAERGAVFAAEEGKRKFTFKAKGKKPATLLHNIVKSEKPQRITVPEMEDGGEEPPPVDRTPDPVKDKVEPPAARDANPGATQRTIGWVALGVGGVAAVVGTITGLNTITSKCSGNGACLPEEKESAQSSGAIATVAFVFAALGIGGGLVLLFTAPSAPPASGGARGASATPATGVAVTPRIGAGWAGLSGTF